MTALVTSGVTSPPANRSTPSDGSARGRSITLTTPSAAANASPSSAERPAPHRPIAWASRQLARWERRKVEIRCNRLHTQQIGNYKYKETAP